LSVDTFRRRSIWSKTCSPDAATRRRTRKTVAEFVLDASAVLADLHGEPGGDVVRPAIRGSVISAVNLAEIITNLIDHGVTAEQASFLTDQLSCEVFGANRRRAGAVGPLHAKTRRTGVSLGDRFCLALAQELGVPALTADRRWKDLDLGIQVQLIR
jgi:ribonuclease VapC